ncbi:hypothetical protein OSTOST_25386 [Ostertagia ostertagi]
MEERHHVVDRAANDPVWSDQLTKYETVLDRDGFDLTTPWMSRRRKLLFLICKKLLLARKPLETRRNLFWTNSPAFLTQMMPCVSLPTLPSFSR